MPKFRITAPDGKTYEVTGPEGSTSQEALARVQAQVQAPAPDYSNATSGATAGPGVEFTQKKRPSANDSDFARMVSGAPRPTDTAQPSLFRSDSDFAKRAGLSGVLSPTLGIAAAKDMFGSDAGVAEYLAGKVGGRVGQDQDGSPTVVLKDGTSYRVNDPGLDVTDVGNFAGNVAAAWIPAGWAARFNQAKGLPLLARMGTQGAAAGATDAALQGAFDPKHFDPVQSGLATVGGAGGEAISTGAGQLLTRLRGAGAAQGLADKAGRQGVPLRGANLNPTQLKQSLRSIPGTGAPGRYDADVLKVNERLAELIGAPRGLPPEQVFPAALTRNTGEFSQFAQNYTMTLTQPLLTKLTNFRNAPNALGGPTPAAQKAVDEFLDEVATLGTTQVPGGLFKRLDTALGGQSGARGLVNDLRTQFRAGMSAADAARWDDLMRRYGDMKTVERLYAKAAGKPVDPRLLLGAVNATKSGKARMAAGTRGDLGELAEVGRYVLAPKEGAGNLIAPGALTLGAGAGGAMTGGGALPAAAAAYGGGNIVGRLLDLPVYTSAQRAAAQQTGPAFPALLSTAASRRGQKKK